jgi:hypothetical protein
LDSEKRSSLAGTGMSSQFSFGAKGRRFFSIYSQIIKRKRNIVTKTVGKSETMIIWVIPSPDRTIQNNRGGKGNVQICSARKPASRAGLSKLKKRFNEYQALNSNLFEKNFL